MKTKNLPNNVVPITINTGEPPTDREIAWFNTEGETYLGYYSPGSAQSLYWWEVIRPMEERIKHWRDTGSMDMREISVTNLLKVVELAREGDIEAIKEIVTDSLEA